MDASAIDPAVLASVVRQVRDSPTALPGTWALEPLGAGRGPATGGVFRVAGRAPECDQGGSWACVVKVVARPPGASDDPGHPLYWQREALAYESGLLADLPGGLRAARCYMVEARPGGGYWFWLEALQDRFGTCWPPAQYSRAAAALGGFNGAYLAGAPRPAAPWLVRPGSLRGLLRACGFMREVLAAPQTWADGRVRVAFPPPLVTRLLALWANADRLLDALDRLPQTFSHLDAWRRNMFVPPGDDRLVLIDWSYVGYTAMGTDGADLFAASYGLAAVEPVVPEALAGAVFDSYVAGLRAAGWDGDARLARLGFAAVASLKYGLALLWLPGLGDPARAAAWEAFAGMPLDAFLDQQARLIPYLLDLAAEAQDLVTDLDLGD